MLLIPLGDPITGWIPATATGSTAVWLVISLIGVVIQWTLRHTPADKPA